MSNPIQTVLEAQAKAQAEIAAARDAAAERLNHARAAARQIVDRNAERTLAAVRDYERHCRQRSEGEIDRVRADAERGREQFMELAEFRLDPAIEKALDTIWPDS